MAPRVVSKLPQNIPTHPHIGHCYHSRPGSAPVERGAGRLAPSKAAQLGQESSVAFLGSHPDAIRRRQQALARKAAANIDKQNAQNMEWWKTTLPSNVIAAMDQDTFQEAIAQDKLVVVDFFAPWCNACRRLFPALVKLAENNPDVAFVKVNGGDSILTKFVESLAVDKLPYFHFYKGGELISHFAANLTKVSMLRAEIAAHKECVLSAILDSPLVPYPAGREETVAE